MTQRSGCLSSAGSKGRSLNGATAWDGTVAVFDLTGHPDAKRAYAWSYERPDGKRRFFAVLHVGGITGPREAVRAAIVAEARRKQ